MKNMKKLFSLALALVMMMALVVTAGAAGNVGNITINDPLPGKQYNVYKIFDEVYDANGNYSYTLSSTSPWMPIVEKYFTVTAQAADPSVSNAVLKDEYFVKDKDGKVTNKILDSFAAQFAADLKAGLEGTGLNVTPSADVMWTAPETETPTSYTFKTGALGYYFITSDAGSLCNLTNANPTATIYDKNDKPTIDKTVDDTDKVVGIGQVLTYTITGKVPSTTGYEEYVYSVSDTMSAGLTFNNDSVVVKVGETTLTQDTDYDINFATRGDNGFNLQIDVTKLQDKVGETITVTYTATVNENAVDQVNKNEATLTYTNDPVTKETTTTPPKEVDVYTGKIVINKYAANNADETDMNTKLAGAKFVLARYVASEPSESDELDPGFTPEFVMQYYKISGGVISWVSDIENATEVTTLDDGSAKFEGLEDGNYALIETKAPTGYNVLTEPVPVSIENANSVAAATQTADVANSTGAELPATGGIGTTIFTVTGAILMIGAAVLFLTKKRTEA